VARHKPSPLPVRLDFNGQPLLSHLTPLRRPGMAGRPLPRFDRARWPEYDGTPARVTEDRPLLDPADRENRPFRPRPRGYPDASHLLRPTTSPLSEDPEGDYRQHLALIADAGEAPRSSAPGLSTALLLSPSRISDGTR